MEGYYCAKAHFKNSKLTMSVNVRMDGGLKDICQRAYSWFMVHKGKGDVVDSISLYSSESDMHAGKFPLVDIVIVKTPVINGLC